MIKIGKSNKVDTEGVQLKREIKLASYYRERKKVNFMEEVVRNEEKISYWNKILGTEVMEYLEEKNEIVSKLCSEQFVTDYALISESAKIFYEGTYKYEILPTYSDKEKIMFFGYYSILLKTGITLLKEKWENKFELNKKIIGAFAEQLYSKLSVISIRTLVLELNICKETDRLVGQNTKEEYSFFDKKVLSEKYIREMFSIYPVLERCVFETIDRCVKNFIRVIERLAKDQNEIEESFFSGKAIEGISEIKCDVSDSHRNGQGVFIFKFNTGKKLVYKPHGLECEKSYYDFVDSISVRCQIDMYKIKTLDRQDYGWVEFVEYKSCSSVEEVKKYYERLGVFIFVNYLLNANDMHYENLIAHGEYPVIVDLETILHNKKTWNAKTANLKINQELGDSVLNSGILPKYIWGNRKTEGVNVSAISGEEGQEFPIKMPTLEDGFTSEMHFGYEAPKTSKKQNMVAINNIDCDAENYVNEILQGFHNAYLVVVSNREEIQNTLKKFEKLNLRFIVRNTQRYSMLLYLSYHPFFLQNGCEREMLLNILYKDIDREDANMCQIVVCEVSDLLNGDIPYFYYGSDSKDLIGGNNRKITNFFEVTSLEVVDRKIQTLCLDDCRKQMSYIVLSLSSLSKYHLGGKKRSQMQYEIKDNKVNSKMCYMEAATTIAEYLRKSAIFNDDKSEVNWIGIGIVGNQESRWSIAPLNTYLYDGVAGMAVFFWTYRKMSEDQSYDEICDSLKWTLFHYTDFVYENNELAELSGAYSGEASIIYAYEILYRLTNKVEFLNYAEKHFEILDTLIEQDNNFDILLGDAGAIHVLLNLYEITAKAKYIKAAEKAANHIVKNKVTTSTGIGWKSNITVNPLAGYSHGVAGISSALLRLQNITKNYCVFQAAVDALKYEESLFLPELGNWCDKRELNNVSEEEIGLGPVAWCHGASGILLSRMLMAEYTEGEMLKKINNEMDIAAETTMKYGFNGTHSLCHGDIGNLEILTMYACKSQKEDLFTKCIEYSQVMAKLFVNKQWNCGLPYGQETPSFMLGLAGMGYSMMRYYNPELPAIISLKI